MQTSDSVQTVAAVVATEPVSMRSVSSDAAHEFGNAPTASSLTSPTSAIHSVQGHFALQAAFVGLSLLCAALASLWLMQSSVNAYIQQTYHRASPLIQLESYAEWQRGAELMALFSAQKTALQQHIGRFNQTVVAVYNRDYAYTAQRRLEMRLEAAFQARVQQRRIAAEKARKALAAQFHLRPQDQVFFAGDSLMQGVAPHVQRALLERYNINSVNLSQQSTGLAYTTLFNWPKTIHDTLQSNRNIKILVMLLGPNDPWDMPSRTGKYLQFATPAWEQEYRSRIQGIMNDAHAQGVRVMWLSPPTMRKPELNQHMLYLNRIIQDEVKRNQGLALDTRQILGTSLTQFQDRISTSTATTVLRSPDGIHFSAQGQQRVAAAILANIQVDGFDTTNTP